MRLSLERARAAWAAAQGVHRRADLPLDALVARTGWIRTLGGAEAYLALHARAPGVTIDAVNAAVQGGALQVVPAVRGCIYLVPRADVAIALRVADALSARRNARDLEKVGVPDAELAGVADGVLAALAGGPLDTAGLRRALPDGLVRGLGDVGKKVGVSSTLPPALRKLEFDGRIVRRPVDGRLDTERYVWALAHGDPTAGAPEGAALHRALAERYFAWAGPATLASFVAWSGLGKRDAAAAVKAAGLVPVEVEHVGDCLATEAGLDAPEVDSGRLLPALDNLTALHERAAAFVDPADHDEVVETFGGGRAKPLGDTANLLERVLVHAGRLAGTWVWDPATEDVVVHAFRGAAPVPVDEQTSVRELLRALGHGRRFALDRDDRMRARAAELRGLGG